MNSLPTNWDRYGECPTCGATPGQTCKTSSKYGRPGTDLLISHHTRPGLKPADMPTGKCTRGCVRSKNKRYRGHAWTGEGGREFWCGPTGYEPSETKVVAS